jgi:hypothetical protein
MAAASIFWRNCPDICKFLIASRSANACNRGDQVFCAETAEELHDVAQSPKRYR